MFGMTLCESDALDKVESCCSHTCSDDDTSNNDENDEKGGCDDLCNPFMSCSTCVGFTVPIFEVHSSKVTEVPELIIALEREHTNSVTVSIWNPPKFS